MTLSLSPLSIYANLSVITSYSIHYTKLYENDKTVTITKSSNARNIANLEQVIGTLKQGSVVQLDPKQTSKKHIVNRQQYDFYVATVKTPAQDSSSALTVGTQVYSYNFV